MAPKKQFCDAMEKVWKNHGVYIGTANGEYTELLTIRQIKQMEINYGYDVSTTNKNIRRVLSYIGKCYENGYDMSESRAGDCSGIIVGVLRDLKVIGENDDYRAKDFQKMSTPVKLEDLQPADLVFDKSSDAGHVGVYVGDGYAIESRGRDYGVQRYKVSERSWKTGGRLNWWTGERVLTRKLKYVEGDLMTGDDVAMVQTQLITMGYSCGKVDGIFGKKTRDAVKACQQENDITPATGNVGKKTCKVLDIIWVG